jgi:rRNA processing protein Gar1
MFFWGLNFTTKLIGKDVNTVYFFIYKSFKCNKKHDKYKNSKYIKEKKTIKKNGTRKEGYCDIF